MMKKKVSVPGERGVKLIHNPVYNKGTAFTERERTIFGLKGLLPPRIISQDLQSERVMVNLRHYTDDLEKYIYMVSLQDRNENLFYYVVNKYLEELMPIIYTPTVGRACQLFGHIYRRSRGLYLSLQDKGDIKNILMNWPHPDVRVIVVTDGGRILGLGDLGVNGMGIPIGKLSLYTACAGIDPTQCLPISVDAGTDNEILLNSPLYLGFQHRRRGGEEYVAFFDEFMESVKEVFPDALVQFEDFSTANAFGLLNRYRHSYRTFNDDIQGTAAVAVAGLISALRITGGKIQDQKVLFLGAGEAGIGIGDMILHAMQEGGCDEQEALGRIWFFDSTGLVCAGRTDLAAHKLKYAHHHAFTDSFAEAICQISPTAIIGVCGQGGQFDEHVIRLMARTNDHPIIFALSNPTSQSECTAEEAYRYSDGRAIFASGSPFAPEVIDGKSFVPGQGNNVYIFPGVGLGAIIGKASWITNGMFYEAAKVVAQSTTREELDKGTIYPSFQRIRQISQKIAVAVIEKGREQDVVTEKLPGDLEEYVGSRMYYPDYPEYK